MGALVSNAGSTTFSVWLQKEAFPQVSVDLQVRVTLKKTEPDGFTFVTVATTSISRLVPSHLSIAIGISNIHETAWGTHLSGPHMNCGGSVSTTVTVWLQKELFPQVSLARQVRVTLKIRGHLGTATLVTVATTSISTLFRSH